MAFMVNYGAKDEKSPGDLNALLDSVVKAMTEDKKVLSSKKEMIGGYPARRFLIEDDDKDLFEARVVIADNRLIQLMFIGPKSNPLGRRFLDSLAIVEPD